MTNTIHLGMPFIEGSQAQKHITHNEALRILDAAVQIGVLDTDRISPPVSPAEGERHIVAGGATGAWTGHANAVAVYEDGAWRFLSPKTGWCAWCDADSALLVYDGAAWTDVASGGGGALPGSVTLLGINDTASAPNLLTVKSNAALFNAIAAAGGGTGDMRLQISKESSAKTASVLFSDAFSGRAEFGLVGSDAFKLKVSNDGSTFVEALVIDQSSGNIALPRSLALTGVISPPQITSNQNDYNPTGIGSASVLNLSSDALRSVSGLVGGAEGSVVAVVNTGGQIVTLLNENASSTAANRFALGSDVSISAKQAVLLRYDGTASRWRALTRPGGREALIANRTYYVRTDGSDSNDGLSNVSGGAFLTIQKAINVIAALDISIYTATIQLGNTGTFTSNVVVNAPWIGTGDVILAGDAATPANTVIANSGGVSAIVVRNNGRLHVKNFKIGTTTGGSCIQADNAAIKNLGGINFGAAAFAHWSAVNNGYIYADYGSAPYSISGGCVAGHFYASLGGTFYIRATTITLSGTPAIGTGFAAFDNLSKGYLDGLTFSGAASGPRYQSTTGSVISAGGGANYFPGNSAGSVSSGGQYL